jgi:hypothetical protein
VLISIYDYTDLSPPTLCTWNPTTSYPGSNPAPLYYNGAFYVTNSPCQTVYTTPRLVTGAKWATYGSIDHSVLPENWLAEDPTMWVDKRNNFHIVNHVSFHSRTHARWQMR